MRRIRYSVAMSLDGTTPATEVPTAAGCRAVRPLTRGRPPASLAESIREYRPGRVGSAGLRS